MHRAAFNCDSAVLFDCYLGTFSEKALRFYGSGYRCLTIDESKRIKSLRDIGNYSEDVWKGWWLLDGTHVNEPPEPEQNDQAMEAEKGNEKIDEEAAVAIERITQSLSTLSLPESCYLPEETINTWEERKQICDERLENMNSEFQYSSLFR